MFSYTYSHLRGNYTGLTSTDIADGIYGGRNSPNNSRSFDEAYFSWNANGGSSSGSLPTDRPNTFKGYAYYELPWLGNSPEVHSDFGIFQYLYQRHARRPASWIWDININGGDFAPVDVVNRGKYQTYTQNPTTGLITIGAPTTFRTPWYIQTTSTSNRTIRLANKRLLSFSATFSNLFNQHAATVLWGGINTLNQPQYLAPNGQAIFNGVDFYAAAMGGFNLQQTMNSSTSTGKPLVINSGYDKPMFYQLSRNIRLGLKFTF